MTTHTPQNWTIELDGEGRTKRILITSGKKGFVITDVTTHEVLPMYLQQGEDIANARLIASAPQMYELLTQVRNYTHEPLPEELQKEIAHVLYTINTKK